MIQPTYSANSQHSSTRHIVDETKKLPTALCGDWLIPIKRYEQDGIEHTCVPCKMRWLEMQANKTGRLIF